MNRLDLNLYGKLKKRFDRLISEIDFENNRDFLFIIINQRYVSLNEQKRKKKKKEEEEEIQTTTTHILATLIRKQSS